MSRKLLIRQNQFPYHISTRSNHKWWYQIPMDKVWKLFINSLTIAQKKQSVDIQAFVLMSNHYHLLIRTPQCNIDKFMFELNRHFSMFIRHEIQTPNRMFGERYSWNIIMKEKYIYNVYRYIFQNPLRAGIVKCGFKYPYSSFYRGTFPFPLKPDLDLVGSEEVKNWLNLPFKGDELGMLSKGLRKKELISIRSKNSTNYLFDMPSGL